MVLAAQDRVALARAEAEQACRAADRALGAEHDAGRQEDAVAAGQEREAVLLHNRAALRRGNDTTGGAGLMVNATDPPVDAALERSADVANATATAEMVGAMATEAESRTRAR